MRKIFLSIIILMLLFSCKDDIKTTEDYQKNFDTNYDNALTLKDYQVEKAFEIDGVVIYKFYGSDGNVRYLAISKDKLTVDNSYTRTVSTGKNAIIKKVSDSIETIKR